MRQVRATLALLLAGAAASYGVAGPASSAHAAAPPVGGCWAYEPSGAALTSPPASDVSTAREPWTTTTPAGEVALATAGATVTGGTRSATATITSGPDISPTVAVSGTASFLLSVDGTPLAAPVTVPFEADPGEPVENLVATADQIPVGAAGAHTVRIDAVYFDVPTETLRVACNGQTQQVASPGANPATTPLPTDVTTSFTAVAAASATITAVADQAVTNAGRPADVATVQVAGLASNAPATLQLCNAAGACSNAGSVTTGADGAATTTFMVLGNAPVGAGILKVSDGTTSVTTPFTVLGLQTVAAAEKLDVESTVVTLTGTGWDPTRPVTIRGYAGASSSAAATADPVVTATVNAAGAFTAEYEVADEATESVIVNQARSATHIGSVYLISGVIGGAPGPDDGAVDPEDPDDESESEGDGGAGTDTGGGAVPIPIDPPAVVDPPADIPLPGELPVAEPDAGSEETPSEEAVEDLSVTEARLDGQATLAELFGGAPQRDLVFIVENVGDETVENPIVRVSVGRSEDVEPEVVDAEVGVLDPGEQAVVTVPLELPMAAFGTYTVVGQVGDTSIGAFELEWTTYPWGLFVLNALALLLLALGVRHRLGLRRKASAGAIDLTGGDAVVNLAAADAWAAYRGGTGPKPRPAASPLPPLTPGPAPLADDPVDGAAVVDLDAAERWWSRRAEAS